MVFLYKERQKQSRDQKMCCLFYELGLDTYPNNNSHYQLHFAYDKSLWHCALHIPNGERDDVFHREQEWMKALLGDNCS